MTLTRTNQFSIYLLFLKNNINRRIKHKNTLQFSKLQVTQTNTFHNYIIN